MARFRTLGHDGCVSLGMVADESTGTVRPHQPLLSSLSTQLPGWVSVVIPVYNRSQLLHEAVTSVLEQSWRPLEIVIVDDGSSDDTAAVARGMSRVESDVVIKTVTRENGGPGAARQTGVENSIGEYVNFFDSDDLLLPHKIELQVKALEADADAGIAYGRTFLETGSVRAHSPENWSGQKVASLFPALLKGRLWDTSNPLYRRSALDRIGPWAPRRQLEDWEFDCRAAREGVKPVYCESDVNVHRSHSGERLYDAWRYSESALKDRIWAHQQILAHALAAGIGTDEPTFRQFLRSMFLMARIAGERGLVAEADSLLRQVQELSDESRIPILSFSVLVRMIGWKRAVRIGEDVRRFLKGTANP